MPQTTTVKELIDVLQTKDPTSKVIIGVVDEFRPFQFCTYHNGGFGNYTVNVKDLTPDVVELSGNMDKSMHDSNWRPAL